MPIINGQRGAYFQPTEYGSDASGPFFIWRYEGTRAEIEQLIPGVAAAGGQWRVSQGYSGARDILEARFSSQPGDTGGETAIDAWEFFANEVEKDLLQTDNAAVNAITADEKRKIKEAIENPTPGKTPALTTPGAIDVYLLMLEGVSSLRVSAPVVRHTQTVSNNYAIKASLTNVGRLMSTLSFLALEGVPSTVLFNLPNFSVGTEKANLGLRYAWLKRFPVIRVGALQKMQIEQEWEYGLWATTLYGAVI